MPSFKKPLVVAAALVGLIGAPSALIALNASAAPAPAVKEAETESTFNVGMIKVADLPFEDGAKPNRSPKIRGCEFDLNLSRFKTGDVIDFQVFEWKPTLDKEPIHSLTVGDGVVDINGAHRLDFSVYLAGIPHKKNGHHIKMDAVVTSGDETYTRVKTFWVNECEPLSEPPEEPVH